MSLKIENPLISSTDTVLDRYKRGSPHLMPLFSFASKPSPQRRMVKDAGYHGERKKKTSNRYLNDCSTLAYVMSRDVILKLVTYYVPSKLVCGIYCILLPLFFNTDEKSEIYTTLNIVLNIKP